MATKKTTTKAPAKAAKAAKATAKAVAAKTPATAKGAANTGTNRVPSAESRFASGGTVKPIGPRSHEPIQAVKRAAKKPAA